jgi:hypothetical protein
VNLYTRESLQNFRVRFYNTYVIEIHQIEDLSGKKSMMKRAHKRNTSQVSYKEGLS